MILTPIAGKGVVYEVYKPSVFNWLGIIGLRLDSYVGAIEAGPAARVAAAAQL